MTNIIHKDYGRVLPGARKDLLNGGVLNVSNFFELSLDEKLTQIKKKSIWDVLDYQKMKDDGYSAFGAYYLKAIKDSLPPETSSDFSHAKLANNAENHLEILSYLYVSTLNKIKNYFTEKPITSVNDIASIFLKIKNDGSLPFAEYAFYRNKVDENYITDNDTNLKISIIYDELESQFPKLSEHFDGLTMDERYLVINKALLNTMGRFSNFYKLALTTSSNYNQKQSLDRSNSFGWNKLIKVENIEEIKYPTVSIENGVYINNIVDVFKDVDIKVPKFLGLSSYDYKYHIEQQHLMDIRRQGLDWRDRKNIDAEKLEKDIGFNGVQWGEWVNGKNERQLLLNITYDSLFDLSKVLNIDEKSISLDNNLAIAFGSQGKKNAKAHFNIGHQFIHLNRMNGAGSLAHEWFHAYDNYLFNKFTKNNPLPPSLQSHFVSRKLLTPLIDFIIQRPSSYPNELRLLKEFDNSMVNFVEALHTDILSKEKVSDVVMNPEYFYSVNQISQDYLTSTMDDSFLKKINKGNNYLNDYLLTMIILLEDDRDHFSRKGQNIRAANRLLHTVLEPNNKYIEAFGNDLETSNSFINHKHAIANELKIVATDLFLTLTDKDKINDFRVEYYNHLVSIFSEIAKKIDNHPHFNSQKYSDEFINLLKSQQEIDKNKNHDFKEINFLFYRYNDRKLNEIIDEIIGEDIPKQFINYKTDSLESNKSAEKVLKHSIFSYTDANIRFVKTSIRNFAYKVLEDKNAKILFQNNIDINISSKNDDSFFMKCARNIDNLTSTNKKLYYALPEELLARAGASLVQENIKNNFLSAGNEPVKINANNDLSYTVPIKEERVYIFNCINNSLKQHFPEFKRVLENNETVEDVYSLDGKTSNLNNNPPSIDKKIKKVEALNINMDEEGREQLVLEPTTTDEAPVKRGRGRPRKVQVESKVEDEKVEQKQIGFKFK